MTTAWTGLITPETAGSFRQAVRQTVRPDPENAGIQPRLERTGTLPTPDLFTVTEVAIVLRIGRTTAYELARRDLASDGGEGLDVRRIGGQLRIPRAALERIVGRSIYWPPDRSDDVGVSGTAQANVIALVPRPADSPSHPSTGHPQSTVQAGSDSLSVPTLPFPS